jgi:YVTN family beta-propeller protein
MGTALVLFWGDTARSNSAGLLLAVNQVDHTLVIVDPSSGKPVSVVAVGVNGHEVAVSPDGALAYVPIYSDVGLGAPGTDGKTIDVVDIRGGKKIYSIDLGKAVRPHKAIFGKDGMLYVTAELDNSIYVVDPKSRTVVGSIPTGESQSHMIAIHEDFAYTANVESGTVSVLDLKQRKLLGKIHAAPSIQRITLSPDGELAFTHAKDNRVIVIDTKMRQVKTSIPTPGMPYSSAITSDGKFLIVLMPSETKLLVIDVGSSKIVHQIAIPSGATEVFVNPLGEAYVSCFTSGQLAELNLKTWTINRMIGLSRGVDGLAWSNSR